MNKDTKPSADFKKATSLAKELQIKLWIDTNAGDRDRDRFKNLLQRQYTCRSSMKDRYQRQRGEAITTMTQKLLDERVTQIHPALKPRFLATDDLNRQKEAARGDAKYRVLQSEEQGLSRYDQKCLTDQQRFVDQLKSKQMRMDFNSKGKGESKNHSIDGKGRSR